MLIPGFYVTQPVKERRKLENRHFLGKLGNLGRDPFNLGVKNGISYLIGRDIKVCIQVLIFTQWVKHMLMNDGMLKF